MVVGKIISIFDISVEVILSDTDVKLGDILKVKDDDEYLFEVVNVYYRFFAVFYKIG